MSSNIARAASVTVVLFAVLILTHAAFVDYRSPGERAGKPLSQTPYLQNRKFGVETSYWFERISWRGQIRQKWTAWGLCCGVYDLLVRMKGGPTRTRLLASLVVPKNKLQLANELGVDWKAIDRHIERMLEFDLIQVVATVGTCTIYSITEKGSRALRMVQELTTCEQDHKEKR
jgi:DNA-binding HxlR family transcriptional regulator